MGPAPSNGFSPHGGSKQTHEESWRVGPYTLHRIYAYFEDESNASRSAQGETYVCAVLAETLRCGSVVTTGEEIHFSNDNDNDNEAQDEYAELKSKVNAKIAAQSHQKGNCSSHIQDILDDAVTEEYECRVSVKRTGPLFFDFGAARRAIVFPQSQKQTTAGRL